MFLHRASLALVLVLTASLGVSPAPAVPSSRMVVVAAENFYGDIVGQLAGDRVAVTNILSDPNVDPHAYESTARDAAAVADARLVIQNGLGYDGFIEHLLAASPSPQRRLIVVAALTGHHPGDNPHLWYDPATIPKVARAVLGALLQIDPGHAGAYRDRDRAFQVSMRPVTEKIASLRARAAGTPIAATEPVFDYMARAIGLEVRTPVAFQKAVEDGIDPPAAALARMEDQLRTHRVAALLYDTQTVSPVTSRVRRLAEQAGIPVVGVSETEPPGTSYQRWMLGQLDALDAALSRGKR